MRVLIVEDDFISRQFLMEIISRYGFDCDEASDGVQALNAYNNALSEGRSFDLICMDVMMPEMDGLTALARIRSIEDEKRIRKENRVKVIMVTGVNDPHHLVDARTDKGATSYISKPVDMSALMAEIKAMGLLAHDPA